MCENVLYTFRSAKNLFAGESFDSDIVLGQLEVGRVFTEFELEWVIIDLIFRSQDLILQTRVRRTKSMSI